MGAVKQFYHEEICAMQTDGREPDDLELLRIDAEQALERYEAAVKKHYEGPTNVKPV